MGAKVRPPPLTCERLRNLLSYDPKTGIFTRRAPRSGCKVEDLVGSVRADGYRRVCVDGRGYLEHRLAWFYVHGVWPKAQIDHKERDRGDNRIDELREATPSQQCQNRGLRMDSTTGLPGVGWHKGRKKWQARIGHGGTRKHIGLFDTAEAAYAARQQAKAVLHTFQPEVRE